ncbi:MAG: hypothetical protein ACKVT0_16750 [Planctomycetaceae bacterium]
MPRFSLSATHSWQLTLRFAAIAVICLLTASFRSNIVSRVLAEDAPEVVSADDARNYVGKKITAKMTVKTAKNSVKRKTVFLDSQLDFNDPKNLGITLDEPAQQKFAAAGIAEPHVYYKDKTIRVTGTPNLQDERVYIKVDEPSQIVVD